YQRKDLSNARSSVTDGAALSLEGFNEEEQLVTNRLRDQEDE
ncbi:unnamed protein product, partial [Rotaria sp. Silwood1]